MTNWTQFTKRTNDPKLAALESMLDQAGIPHRRHGDSFHAPILQVPDERLDDAWKILDPIDDIPDDDPRFVVPRPELAELPRPVAFPYIRTFAELFPVLTDRRQAHAFGNSSEISNWVQIREPAKYSHTRAMLPQWLIDWLQENMLAVDHDSIYFQVIVRDDQHALVTAQYNQIIGSRWLALIDTNSVNT